MEAVVVKFTVVILLAPSSVLLWCRELDAVLCCLTSGATAVFLTTVAFGCGAVPPSVEWISEGGGSRSVAEAWQRL